jgi:hypothetical protein
VKSIYTSPTTLSIMSSAEIKSILEMLTGITANQAKLAEDNEKLAAQVSSPCSTFGTGSPMSYRSTFRVLSAAYAAQCRRWKSHADVAGCGAVLGWSAPPTFGSQPSR